MNEYSTTMDRLRLGLVGLEGDALGLGALFAHDRNNQLFLGLGNDGFRPKGLAECSIVSIGRTAATSLSMALAHDVGGRKNLAKRQ